ncbi:hypothetical protein AX14_013670 [Amanita brunnescens Koide BX004]|nr:hypothetical protein AX14_013670 [Amanita brunnescens Koide BX004]
MHTTTFLSTLALVWAGTTLAGILRMRQDSNTTNIVKITSTNDHCIIVPRDPHTNIGDSEYSGGETTYCTSAGRTSPDQGTLPDNFWKNVESKTDNGVNGNRFIQLTGCINPDSLDRLNADDDGGQYDSSGGPDGQGNPQGSMCIGFKSYVQLIEPSASRACIRCCEDDDDCPTNKDRTGCTNVIAGNYFDCA